MPGIKALRRIQLGQEATAGTAVAATALWRGIGTIQDTREMVFPDEDIGFVSPTDRSYQPKLEGALAMDPVEATFEQLGYILTAGVADLTAGVADGGGTDFIYDYVFATTAQKTIQTFTLEGGDNQQAEEFNYCFVLDFTLSGESFAAWMMSANWIGREVTPTTFTGSITVPTVEEILFAKTKLFVDVIGGTHGTTQLSLTLLAAELNVTTGFLPIPVGDGNLFYASHAQKTKPEVVCSVTFEHDGSATAELVNWRAQTPLLLQLISEGSVFGTPGTTYSNHTLIINLTGKWESFEKIGEQDGNDIVTGVFRAGYDATPALLANMIVVNEDTTLV